MTGYVLQFTISMFSAIFVAAVLESRRTPRLITTWASAAAALIVLAVALAFANISGPKFEVNITIPKNGEVVSQRIPVAGEVGNEGTKLWVLVHPVAQDVWWVQDSPVILADGRWHGYANLGTSELGAGQTFEIIALASNETSFRMALRGVQLQTNQELHALPPYYAKSNLIAVTRGR
jgi:hypothetical protein